jgi:hypothetical protein
MSYRGSFEDEMLSKAARRAAASSVVLLASAFAEWSRAFGTDPKEALGLDGRRFEELALCRRPRADCWVADATLLATEFGMEPSKLISLLRAAEAAESFRYGDPAEAGQTGRLLAARDRDEENER